MSKTPKKDPITPAPPNTDQRISIEGKARAKVNTKTQAFAHTKPVARRSVVTSQAKLTDEAAADSTIGESRMTPHKPASKNQQKKIAKLARLAVKKAYKKEQEKIAKKEAAEKRRQNMAAKLEGLGAEEVMKLKQGYREQAILQIQERREKKREQAILRIQERREKKHIRAKNLGTGPKLVLDLDFEGLMVDADVISLCQQGLMNAADVVSRAQQGHMNDADVRSQVQQLKFAYADNMKMEHPCHLIFTSYTGVVKATAPNIVAGIEKWAVTTTDKNYIDNFAEEKEKIVYLTADSENELDELDESKIYIIGGLVDHNMEVHKGLCLKRADAAGIATARLPIQKYVQLTSRAVLTVNQVVQMMAEYFNKKDWQTVIDLCMPSRKRADKGAGKQDPAEAKKSDDGVVEEDMVDEKPVVADETTVVADGTPVVTEKSAAKVEHLGSNAAITRKQKEEIVHPLLHVTATVEKLPGSKRSVAGKCLRQLRLRTLQRKVTDYRPVELGRGGQGTFYSAFDSNNEEGADYFGPIRDLLQGPACLVTYYSDPELQRLKTFIERKVQDGISSSSSNKSFCPMVGVRRVYETQSCAIPIGRGAFSEVFKGLRQGTDEHVAIKYLTPFRIHNAEVEINKIINELVIMLIVVGKAHLAGALGYYVDTAVDNSGFTVFHVCIVQDLAISSLEAYVEDNPNMSYKVLIRFMNGMLRGLQLLMRMKIVHNDIKPANVLVFKDAKGDLTVKISDFGLAVIVESKDAVLSG
eukprot:gene26051-11750_t